MSVLHFCSNTQCLQFHSKFQLTLACTKHSKSPLKTRTTNGLKIILNVLQMCILSFSPAWSLPPNSSVEITRYVTGLSYMGRPRSLTVMRKEIIRITRILDGSYFRTDSWNFVNSIVTLFADHFHPSRADKKAQKSICSSVRGTSA